MRSFPGACLLQGGYCTVVEQHTILLNISYTKLRMSGQLLHSYPRVDIGGIAAKTRFVCLVDLNADDVEVLIRGKVA